MTKDDVVAGIIGGTIFIAGCIVGFFGYLKMNDIPISRVSINHDKDISVNNTDDYAEKVQDDVQRELSTGYESFMTADYVNNPMSSSDFLDAYRYNVSIYFGVTPEEVGLSSISVSSEGEAYYLEVDGVRVSGITLGVMNGQVVIVKLIASGEMGDDIVMEVFNNLCVIMSMTVYGGLSLDDAQDYINRALDTPNGIKMGDYTVSCDVRPVDNRFTCMYELRPSNY